MIPAGLSRRIAAAIFSFAVPLLLPPLAARAADDAAPATAGDEKTPAKSEAAAGIESGPDSTVEEVVVTGSSLSDAIDEARFSTSVVDVLNAKDFQVTGDSGVVDALSRVTGVTTVNDKYVYVRGLGERYSSTLFNGALLPSPDPSRRVVPLDLFPSGVMDQLSVQKTYTPSLPADFSGGSVQMKTLQVPSERLAKLAFSSDYRLGTTFTRRDWYEGSGSDWTGYDGSYRHLPSDMPDIGGFSSLSQDEQTQLALALNRAFDTERKTIAPNFKIKGAYADTYDLFRGKAGFILGGIADNKWLNRKENVVKPNTDSYTAYRTNNNVQYSGLFSGTWSPLSSQTLDATVFYTHTARKDFIEQNNDLPQNAQQFVTEVKSWWEEQTLWTAQLDGNHNLEFHDLGFDWSATYSTASRVRPDARVYRYDAPQAKNESGQPVYDDNGNPVPDWNATPTFSNDLSNERSWENLTDDVWDLQGASHLPVKFTSDITSTLTLGGRWFDKQRRSETRVYRYEGNNTRWPAGTSIDDIFSDDHIGYGPFLWRLRDASRPEDQYNATDKIKAGFLQTDTEIGSRWRLMVGTRYEDDEQSVLKTETDQRTTLQKDAFYPVVELTWLLRDDLQLRGGFSQTINRPDLREIADAKFFDPETQNTYVGYSQLEVAELSNFDLRLEWYHSGQDHIELAAFYKDLKNPIEEIYFPVGNVYTWRNADSAYIYGFETDARQSLSPLGRWADDFYARGNFSWIESEAKVAPGNPYNLTNPKHPLQGQSPWIVNLQLTWENLPTDTDATIAFNTFGERLTALGTFPTGDAYEQPRAQVDLTFRHGITVFGQDLDLTVKARNILNSRVEVKRDSDAGSDLPPVTERSYRLGPIFTVEIGKSW